MKNKLPGTTVIAVYQVGGIGITHDIDEAFELFKEFVDQCFSDDCPELDLDSLDYPEKFRMTVETSTVNSYFSSNRYNISNKDKKLFKEQYDIDPAVIESVETEILPSL